jgi:hypothetical protein
MSRPVRHSNSGKSRKKTLSFAKDLHGELEYLDRKLRRLRDEHVRYALGRIERVINRLRAK